MNPGGGSHAEIDERARPGGGGACKGSVVHLPVGPGPALEKKDSGERRKPVISQSHKREKKHNNKGG